MPKALMGMGLRPTDRLSLERLAWNRLKRRRLPTIPRPANPPLHIRPAYPFAPSEYARSIGIKV
jgi:hypothetical protein